MADLDSSLHSQFEQYDLEISENERITLEQNIDTKQQELNILWENCISQFEDNIIDKYAGLISSITTSNTIESNFKDYYSELFDYYAGDFNLSTALTSLNTIAAQCPAAGGPSVFYARNLIAMLDTAQVYDDETLCGSSARVAPPEIAIIENEPLIMVFPNPFTNNININTFGFNSPPDLQIEINDLSGRLIKSSVIRKAPYLSSINFGNLEAGGYYLRIISLDTQTEYINQILIKVD
jgi:hypothetical protein